jgi:cation:H+ antiporter
MTFLIPTLLFCIAIAILTYASDFLVKGASSIAKRFNISQLVIGLTIVAFGTSAPELVVSVFSALNGNTDISLGNITGSNIFNILGILGLCSLVYPLTVHKNTIKQEIPYSLFAALIVPILALIGNSKKIDFSNKTEVLGYLGVGAGAILLFFFVLFLLYIYNTSKQEDMNSEEIEVYSTPKSITYITLGLIGLTLGAKLAVDNALKVGTGLGISEKVLGLTIVAIGTSLPELFASMSASLKKNSDLAIGNIVGSNIFNIYLILGITSIIKPIPMTGSNIADSLILIITTILLIGLILIPTPQKLKKIEGTIMLLCYLAYTIYLIKF